MRLPPGLKLGEPLYPGPELKGCASGPRPGSTPSPAAGSGGIEVSSLGCRHPPAGRSIAASSAAHLTPTQGALKRIAGGARDGRLGEAYLEGRARADHALDGDVPAVHLDDLAADGEPEAAPPGRARAVLVHPVEALEELAQVLLRYADAGVLDLDGQVRDVLPYPDVHAGAGVGVLYGVVQQVEEDLVELLGVAHAPVLGGAVEVYLDAEPGGLRLDGLYGSLDDSAHVRRPDLELVLPGVQLGKRQELLHHPPDAPELPVG